MTLDRKAFLGFRDDRIGRVTVEEMGGEVCVASLTVAEADKIRTLGDDGVPSAVRLAILGACDDKGIRLFTEDDIPMLMALPASVLGTVASAILKHNGLARDSSDEAKNASSETENGDSASASPSSSDEPLPS